MTNVLIVLRRSADYSRPYYAGIHRAFPEVKLDLVDDVDKAGSLLGEADVLITFGPHMTDAAFRQMKNLKWLQSMGTGVDAVINRPMPKDTIITTIRGVHATPVSEAALLGMLSLVRHFPDFVRAQDRHEWARESAPLRTLEGKTAGIFGIGLIAEGLAPRLKALGMRVFGITSSPRDVPAFDRVYERDALMAVVPDLDFLVLLTPYTKATHHIVDAHVFAAMKPSAYLINLARGGVVDEGALVATLNAGRIAGAALDVFVTEPLTAESPLWSARNVIITPHLAGESQENREKILAIITENMRRFLAGDYAGMLNVVKR